MNDLDFSNINKLVNPASMLALENAISAAKLAAVKKRKNY
jgi:hypothetical protein